MATWRPYVALGVKEVETRFDLTGGTYPGHADGDPGHDMSGDRAADFWTTSKSKHDQVISWFVRNDFENAKRLGMTYIISWRRIASVSRASEGIRPYTRYGPDASASQAHTNHVHISWGNTAPTGDIKPPPVEEDELPSLEEIADYLARDTEFTQAVAVAAWQKDGTVNNVGFAAGSEGSFVSGSDALEGIMKRVMQVKGDVGVLENHSHAEFVAVHNHLKEIDQKLIAIIESLK